MYKIVTVPNEVLTAPTKEVRKIDKKILEVIKEMRKTLKAQSDPPGVGLSANQVGIPLSIFIMKPDEHSKMRVFINPRILQKKVVKKKKKEKKNIELEGCLSIPKIWGVVKRADEVLLEYRDERGELKQEWFKGLEAIIVQHEVDHLKGKLFTELAIKQKARLYKENNRGELEEL